MNNFNQQVCFWKTRDSGAVEKAAKILGIGERTLYRKIKEYNL